MGWIGSVHCEKFRCDFVAQTCALITPVQPILHRVSCSNEILPNTPKHYETHQNMSLWSNGVDRVRSLRKIPMRFHGTNLCINCTIQPILHRVLCSNETLPNTAKHYETHTNMSLGSNRVDWEHSLRKILMRLHGTNFSINAPGQTILHRLSCCNKTLPNATKYY